MMYARAEALRCHTAIAEWGNLRNTRNPLFRYIVY